MNFSKLYNRSSPQINHLDSVEGVITALRKGRLVLVHDEMGREDEIDMVIAAEQINPDHISTLRRIAGGLICLAVANEIAVKLGLVYMHEIIQDLSRVNPVFKKLTSGDRHTATTLVSRYQLTIATLTPVLLTLTGH